MRADFVEAFHNFISRQHPTRQDVSINIGQIGVNTLGIAGERLIPEDAETIIDMSHIRRFMPLIVNKDPVMLENDVGGVPASLIAINRHQGQTLRTAEMSDNGT